MEVVVRCYIKLENNPRLSDVALALLTNVIMGKDLPTKISYRLKLRDEFRSIDHIMRKDALKFEQTLDESLA